MNEQDGYTQKMYAQVYLTVCKNERITLTLFTTPLVQVRLWYAYWAV
jgi:hypothetical protein